ncbi:hypothetical protein M513_08735 [Trichuris suis]|uniref:Uncharacterized protein n=1 Tax=Trichuris suis TaxID=68888 RepID=A0A085LZF7_9BILA|nr:hypothetical protein M513_08735 [Trichuris suis]
MISIDRRLTNQNCSKIEQSASPQLDQSSPVITSNLVGGVLVVIDVHANIAAAHTFSSFLQAVR